MITIKVNGIAQQIAEELYLANALEQHLSEWQTTSQPFAIAINAEFIPKNEYANTPVKDGDHIELVSPMQGG